MIRKILLTTVTCILLAFISCSETGLGPQKIEPGRRDYVWTIDTLDGMQMNSLHSVWGSSPQNVWAVGPGGTENDRLWHYDGNSWSIYTKEQIWCTGTTIFGFSANNVWMGGGAGWLDGPGGGIWHYDGSKWSKNFIYKVEGSYIVNVTNIYGSQSNDIYACGTISYIIDGKDEWRGFVLHYNGSSWREVIKVNFDSQFLRIRQEQNKVYVFSYSVSSNDTITLYELDGNELKEIYSNPVGTIQAGNFNVIGEKLYFWIDQDVFLYRDGNFVKQFSINEKSFDYYLFGRNDKDIFFYMRDGLMHFNGEDFQYIFEKPKNLTIILGADILFDKEIFCGAVDFSSGTNMVLHGKLKN